MFSLSFYFPLGSAWHGMGVLDNLILMNGEKSQGFFGGNYSTAFLSTSYIVGYVPTWVLYYLMNISFCDFICESRYSRYK